MFVDWPISIKIVISARSFPVVSLILGVFSILIGILIGRHELVYLGVTLISLAVVFTVLAIVLERQSSSYPCDAPYYLIYS